MKLLSISLSLLPEGKWTMDNGQDIHLIHDRWRVPISVAEVHICYLNIPTKDLKNVTFETNTTQTLHEDFPTIPMT